MTSLWHQGLGLGAGDAIPVDFGSTSLTAIRRKAVPDLRPEWVAHPIYETLPLSAGEAASLGSDFQRVGALWPAMNKRVEEFEDALGVQWLDVDGDRSPVRHPLEHASWDMLSRHTKPPLPSFLQLPQSNAGPQTTILDPPCPGLLDTCFLIRNAWQFMNDLTDSWRTASALLDWALDVVGAQYAAVLNALPEDPDIIVYGDDLGFESGMYLSDLDFRNFLFARLQTLFSRIRRLSGAKLCFHSCGAIRSILPDIASLGVDMVNLDFYAKNMILADVRRELPDSVTLHGPVNLASLGKSVESGNRGSLALLSTELARSMPCVAAPVDNIGSAEELRQSFRGAAFVRALDRDDLNRLRTLGPVRSIIENACARALEAELPTIGTEEIPVGRLITAGAEDTPAVRLTPDRSLN